MYELTFWDKIACSLIITLVPLLVLTTLTAISIWIGYEIGQVFGETQE